MTALDLALTGTIRMTLTGGIVALPLIGIVLYQAAWLVITLFFPLMQR